MTSVLKRVVVVCLFLLSLTIAHAQQRISGDPATFTTEVTTMMATGANQYAMESGNQFTSAWGGFSATQQKQIIEVTQKLIKSKKLKTNPHFADFFVCLTALQSKGADQVDTMLIITSKLIETYDAIKMGTFLKTVRNVFEGGYLYKSTFHTTMISGGTPRLRLIEPKVPVFEEVVEDTSTQEDYFNDWDNWQQVDETWGTEEIQEVSQNDALNAFAYDPPPQPPVEGPVIEFTGINLTFQTPYDTATIQNTSGAIVFNSNLFIGQGGKMDWSSAGLSQVYCDMAGYNFAVHTYRFISEGAYLHYPEQTDSIPRGVFEFNSMKAKSGGDKSYPRFKSFDSNIPVKGLDENIRYKGGFSLSGRKIYSSSLDEGLASVEILKGDSVIIKGLSNRFLLGDSAITADYCRTVIYILGDSIYHPGTVFKYNKNANKLRLTKTNGFRMAPFIDTYHKIEITADACIWDINSDKIEFNITNARNEIAAIFESEEYYSLQKYTYLKGLYPFHPLQLIVGYADKIKSDEFPIQDLAVDSKIPVETLKGAMMQMMKLGFVDFDKGGMVTLKDKARHYVMSRRDKKDYDNIKFLSTTSTGANAELDLTNQKLIVHGVKRVYISDSLNVTIEPDSSTIEILQNRDFQFNGKINTANFQFIGTDFKFNYDSFFVRMAFIDEIKLTVKDDSSGTGDKSKTKVLGNELRYSSGTLYINEPLNKSSRKKKPQYPIFDAATGASVFFNKSNIANGAYDTTMKFKIPPFKVDSLSSDDPTAIGFDGTFESGGIFPDFDEKLIVMPDNSLGFKHSVPSSGYKTYEGDGSFYGNLKVDNQGLRGNGEIHFLNTTLWSGDFVYFKDSTLTEGNQMITKPGINPLLPATITFPDVHIDRYRMMWKPKVDSMYISNIDKPFEFYNQTASLQGTTIVTHGGMYGLGILSTRGSETESAKFYFEQTKFSAHDATFRIKSDNPNKPALKSIQAKVFFDLEKSLATFGPEQEGFASTEFPYAMYKTSLEKGVWDLNKREIYLNASDSVNIESSYFYSTHPQQDSLVFSSRKAIYKIDSLTLNIYDIPFIKVNDGKVFPDSSHVIIRENAVMQTLHDAKIEMDTVNKYHRFYDATIDIYGRKKFNGKALYEYVNLAGDTLELVFSNFVYTVSEKKKEGAYTLAQCIVKEEDSIYVGEKILYKGNVTLKSKDQFLAFDGYIKLDLKGVLHYASWLKYVNSGESDRVTLNLQNAVSEKGNPLYTGMSFNSKNYLLYTNFISEKTKPDDQDVLVTGTGFQYDADSSEFTVGAPDLLAKKSLKGNYLTYNDNRSTTKFGGMFTIVKETDPSYKLLSSGTGNADLMEDTYMFNILMSLQFKTSTAPFVAMGAHLKSIAEVIPDSVAGGDDFLNSGSNRDKLLEQKLVQFIGDDGLRNYYSKKASGSAPLFNLNSDFAKSLLISDVNLVWSPEYKAFYNVGKVKISSFIKTEIEKYVDAYIEIRKTSSGDQITIYLMPANGVYYYIHYDENRLSMVSSSDDVNKTIKTKGEMPDRSKFFLVKTEPMEMNKFINTFRDRYLDYVPPVEAPSDSTQTLDSTSTGGLRQKLSIDNTDNTQQRQLDNQNSNQYQDANSDPNQYKLQQQDTNYEQPKEDPAKQKPTLEDQQKRYQEQQQLQNLFK